MFIFAIFGLQSMLAALKAIQNHDYVLLYPKFPVDTELVAGLFLRRGEGSESSYANSDNSISR
jgi:hypothetical protein